ncbi:MAG: DUF3231 family protein [Firmicutes bacterium]|nr:DUF3231 family protein [Bacillota bacterium]
MEQAYTEIDVMKSRAPVINHDMGVTHRAPLTSSEIANLWRTYVHYSMLNYVFQHYLKNVEDPDLRPMLTDSIALFEKRMNRTAEIFKLEGQPIPRGFGDGDLDAGAPRLYTDLFYFFYTMRMVAIGLQLNSTALACAVRPDVREFYTETLMGSTRFFNRFTDIMLEKGILIRSPFINTFGEVDTVEEQSFLRGFLGKRRPLLAQEIDQLFLGIRNNVIGGALLEGFRQVARSEPVRAYMARGAEIARKHVDIFSSVLHKENLPAPAHWGEFVSDSTTPPFSDKLMMYHVVTLGGIGLGSYANAMGLSMRHDLGANYARLITETLKYAEDGINILIDNGWLEEPPRMTDRQELVNNPKH